MATTDQTKSIAVLKDTRVPRIDGPMKVSGGAKYTSDYHFKGMVYAVPVGATIAKGEVKKIDSAAAAAMNGVLGIYSHGTIGQLFRPIEDGFNSRASEYRPAFEDETIRYYGQYVAVVAAETYEIAQAAARSIKVTYDAVTPNVALDLQGDDLKKTETERGDAKAAFADATVKIDQTYVTPIEVHNPIELHATVALWDGEGDREKVTLYETSQAIGPHRNTLAQILGVPPERVQVICRFLGSGFGGKLFPWPHSALAAQLARKLARPVKLVVDRQMMFTNVGHRPRTQQRIQLGAGADGKLAALAHTYASQASMLDDYKENCGEVSGFLYGCANVNVDSAVARRNQPTPTSMRGPGAVPGLFALESAMDELAIALKMDPVELRLLNDTQTDGTSGKPFSSRHLAECLTLGAEKFGWAKRKAAVGSMREGDEVLGWGVSSCTWQSRRLDAEVAVAFQADGRLHIACGTHDIGTGMYTVLAQIAHNETGVPFDRIDVSLGDSALPTGPIAGGSMATGSVVPAALEGLRSAVKNLITVATKNPVSALHGQKADDIKMVGGELKTLNGPVAFGPLMQTLNLNTVSGKGSSKGTFGGDSKVSTKSFGAQFVEIGWNPDIARLRVRRVVSVIDGGHIINYVPARNQIEGAIVMGIGMGMFEHAETDARDGNIVNSNLADYIVAVHADCPDIDVTFLDYPDKELNEYGARGVGEIGLAGVASSICSAVYHATGIRVRDLPVKIEDLLKA